MKKICTYIDLLGFSNYINADINDALLLIENYTNTLQIGFNVGDEFKSFETFLPCSDSIFIIANPDSADDFIIDISKFLINCFIFTADAYTNPIDEDKPTKVIINHIDFNIEKKEVETKPIERNWYPTLFKGGVVCDDVETFHQSIIYNGIFEKQLNLAGKGIVSAVALEKSGRGPRLFCNNSIISKLSKDISLKYVIGKNNISEILWPIQIFTSVRSPQNEVSNGYEKLMSPAINLWKSYEKTPVGEIYFNLMKLITISAIRYSKMNDIVDDFDDNLKEFLEINNILHFYESLIDYTSGI